jgi:lipopolysaccharide export system permease protein
MELELHRRFATPFACIVFALAGVPLGIQNRRSGRGGSFSMGIVLILLYYIVLSAFKALGERGAIPALAAMWGPNVCFLALGIWLFRYAAAERPLFSLIPFAPFFARLKYRLTTRKTE